MKVVLAMVLAGLVALPLSVSAQEGGKDGSRLERWHPEAFVDPASEESEPLAEPIPEEPALQLQLDDAGMEVVPSPPRTADGYTLEEMDLRVKRAKIGLGVSSVALAAGVAMGLAAMGGSMCSLGEIFEDDPSCPPPWLAPVGATGAVLGIGGLAGMIVAGVRLARGKRDRDSLRVRSRYHEAVEVDTSDDAFFVIVTRKYEGHELVGATVFIKHKDSGQYAKSITSRRRRSTPLTR